MLKSKIYILLVVVMSLFTYGCRYTATFTKNFNSKKYSLAYISDSKIKEDKSMNYVVIEDVKLADSAISEKNQVIRKSFLFVPFIIVFATDVLLDCKAGKELLEEEIPVFFKENLANEIHRSANFNYKTDGDSSYALEINIEKIDVSGPYATSIIFVPPGLYNEESKTGPVLTNVEVSFVLKKDGKLVLNGTKIGNLPGNQKMYPWHQKEIFQQEFAISMVEALSLDFKIIIESIVSDLNSYFEENS